MFPCVVIGKDREAAVRRLFDADPEVTAWRAEGAHIVPARLVRAAVNLGTQKRSQALLRRVQLS